ncbi:STM4015 family protein [Actinomadura flavalba]|uniref:STM4015 family protein n=1 Tax=Actinomadura flavalba TaxID=1120938 RepID=UPI00036736FC|nr:STM4015 family protein [Actinomadura flavalba]
MSIFEHLTSYAGLPVTDVAAGTSAPAASRAWRVRAPDAAALTRLWDRFRAEADTAAVTALIFGACGDDLHPASLLADAAAAFPELRAVFLGEIVEEERTIAWIDQTDITPVLAGLPRLERLDVRGTAGLALEPVTSTSLRVLRVESAGLPGDVVRALGASDLPNLESLNLWFGTGGYGGDATVDDLAPVLAGDRLPRLTHLGLENATITDEIAAALATAPVVARLESLSLALGTLTDAGAEALLAGQPLTHLRLLDLGHHFLSDETMERVAAALPAADLDGQEDPDDPVFIAIGE